MSTPTFTVAYISRGHYGARLREEYQVLSEHELSPVVRSYFNRLRPGYGSWGGFDPGYDRHGIEIVRVA